MQIEFSNVIVVRSPRFKFNEITDIVALYNLLFDEDFLEAIYIASPNLYFEINRIKGDFTKFQSDIKLQDTLLKYYLRATSRAIPFGLFSGVSTTTWAPQEANSIIKRRTRLDLYLLISIIRKIAVIPEVRRELIYSVNSTLYQFDIYYRFIEIITKNSSIQYLLSSIEISEPLDLILEHCKDGATYESIKEKLLLTYEINHEEACVFLDEVIDSQIIISHLEPSLVGDDFFEAFLKNLETMKGSVTCSAFLKFYTSLNEISKSLLVVDQFTQLPLKNIDLYEKIISNLLEINETVEKNKVFQIDLQCSDNPYPDLQEARGNILNAITLLSKIIPYAPNQSLKNFVDKFIERYEYQEVPLIEALNLETGIGYGSFNGISKSSLLEDIKVSSAQHIVSTFERGQIANYFKEKYEECLRNNSHSVSISDEELENVTLPYYGPLPYSTSVLFQYTSDQRFPISLLGVGGPNGLRMYGRFGYLDKDIKDLAMDISQGEEYAFQDLIFAEIIHLPESRIGNVISHPSYYSYEIPYLALSNKSPNKQLPIDDLMVSIDRKTHAILIRSKKENKYIIPRLSNAHNANHNTLPVYSFLNDLQSQNDRTALTFSWTYYVPITCFYPRLTYKDIVISKATWRIEGALREKMLQEYKESGGFDNFFAVNRIPPIFFLSEGDNELLINLNEKLSKELFYRIIKNKELIVLKEVVGDYKSNDWSEYLATLINPSKTMMIPKSRAIENVEVKRDFALGDEWIYFKIYGSAYSIDYLLKETVYNFVNNSENKTLFDIWFFVRYYDSQNHLRIRFKLKDNTNLTSLLNSFLACLEPHLQKGILHNVVLDSYKREVERYGAQHIITCEKLFYENSKETLEFLHYEKSEEKRWMQGLIEINTVFELFEYPISRRVELLKALRNSLQTEFGFSRDTISRIDKKYRIFKKEISLSIINAGNQTVDKIKYQLSLELNEMSNMMKNEELDDCISSIIHMNLNRLFIEKGRIFEAVLYDFLGDHYLSLLKQNKTLD